MSGEHLALILSATFAVTPIVLAGVNLLTAAGGSQEVFLALIQSLNVPAILTASYVGTFPLLALSCLIFYVTIRHPSIDVRTAHERLRTAIWWIPAVAFIFIFFSMNLLMWATWAPLTVIIALVLVRRDPAGRMRHKRRKKIKSGNTGRLRALDRMLRSQGPLVQIVAFGFILGFISTSSVFWLPPEILSIKGESRAATGYVLKRDETEMSIYWQDGRGVKRYTPDALEYREVCEYPGGRYRMPALIRLIKDPYIIKIPKLQECPLQ